MLTVFEEVKHGKYKRTVTKSSAKRKKNQLSRITFSKEGMPEINGYVIEVSDYIKLEDVPIITPNCDVVVPSLSFTVS